MTLNKSSKAHGERGAGVFAMSIGMLFFFLLLLFAVQILYNLYATTLVSSFAVEAARDVAELDGPTPAAAIADFSNNVGPDGSLTIVEAGGEVRATVTYTSSTVFPAVFNAQPFGVLNRTFVVRMEEQQPVVVP